jgi:hypothetical protein
MSTDVRAEVLRVLDQLSEGSAVKVLDYARALLSEDVVPATTQPDGPAEPVDVVRLADRERTELRAWIQDQTIGRKQINVAEVTGQAMERFALPAACRSEVEDLVCLVIAETLGRATA